GPRQMQQGAAGNTSIGRREANPAKPPREKPRALDLAQTVGQQAEKTLQRTIEQGRGDQVCIVNVFPDWRRVEMGDRALSIGDVDIRYRSKPGAIIKPGKTRVVVEPLAFNPALNRRGAVPADDAAVVGRR